MFRPYLHTRQSPGLAPAPAPISPEVRAGGARGPLTRPFAMMGLMSHRRRRVFVDTPKGRRNAGFTVPETADAADVSMRLRERGWAPYRLRLDSEQHVWIAVVIDWQHAA
jgi:hypothetical protein